MPISRRGVRHEVGTGAICLIARTLLLLMLLAAVAPAISAAARLAVSPPTSAACAEHAGHPGMACEAEGEGTDAPRSGGHCPICLVAQLVPGLVAPAEQMRLAPQASLLAAPPSPRSTSWPDHSRTWLSLHKHQPPLAA